MRALMGIVWVLVVAVGIALSGVAEAGPGAKKKKKNPEEIDISSEKKDLLVLSDGEGHYVVIRPNSKKPAHLFYGDGKTFYSQRVFSSGADPNQGMLSRSFWAPRARKERFRSWAELELRNKVWKVTCGKREKVFGQLPGAEASKILDTATFLGPKWRRTAYALARDEHGNYYYVDRLRDEYGGKGFRLFTGQRGNLKQRKMTNIVSDSEGDIFATRKGDLRMILDKNEAAWVRGKKRTRLTYVPTRANVYMIYAELGVYVERLGTPCDDI